MAVYGVPVLPEPEAPPLCADDIGDIHGKGIYHVSIFFSVSSAIVWICRNHLP